jgi:hypothetical protein
VKSAIKRTTFWEVRVHGDKNIKTRRIGTPYDSDQIKEITRSAPFEAAFQKIESLGVGKTTNNWDTSIAHNKARFARLALEMGSAVTDAVGGIVDVALAIKDLVIAARSGDVGGIVRSSFSRLGGILSTVIGITELVLGAIPAVGFLVGCIIAIITTILSLIFKPKQRTIALREGLEFLKKYESFLDSNWESEFRKLVKAL